MSMKIDLLVEYKSQLEAAAARPIDTPNYITTIPPSSLIRIIQILFSRKDARRYHDIIEGCLPATSNWSHRSIAEYLAVNKLAATIVYYPHQKKLISNNMVWYDEQHVRRFTDHRGVFGLMRRQWFFTT